MTSPAMIPFSLLKRIHFKAPRQQDTDNEGAEDGRTRRTRTTSPGAHRRRTGRDRLLPSTPPRARHHPPPPGRAPRPPRPGPPADAARALPHLDPDSGRQDRDPQDQPGPAGPLPGMVRQRPQTPPARHRPRNPLPASIRGG